MRRAVPTVMNKDNPGASTPKASDRNGSSIRDSVQSLVDQGTETADAIRSRVDEVTDGARSKGSAAYVRTAKFVKANPFASVAIALGVGYVAMRIKTSKLMKIALISGVGYLGTRLFRR